MKVQAKRRDAIKIVGASALLSLIGQRAYAKAGIDILKIVCPYSPGGSADTLSRRVAKAIPPSYARSALVDNRTGAGGQVAVAYVKNQPGDGSIILNAPFACFTLYPYTYKKLPYNPVSDLKPLTVACYYDVAYAVGPAVPASVKTVKDYVQWVKADPKNRSAFATTGAGTVSHFVGEMLARESGLQLIHVPYRGSSAALIDVIGGSVPAISTPVGDLLPQAEAGKLRILGLTGDKRNPFAPNVQTFTEQGYKNMIHKGYYAFFAPARIAREAVAALNTALVAALKDKDVIAGLAQSGMSAMSTSPQEAVELLDRDRAKWKVIVKQVGYVAT